MFHQISVWLPNKPGILSKFIDALIEKNIEIRAITVAENEEYGLILLLVDKPMELYAMLEDADYPVSITDVIAVKLKSGNNTNNTNNIKEISQILGDNRVNIDFLYSTLVKDEPLIILKVDDSEKAKEALKEDGFLLEERDAI